MTHQSTWKEAGNVIGEDGRIVELTRDWRAVTKPQPRRDDLAEWRQHLRRAGNQTRITGGPGRWVLEAKVKKEGAK